MQYIQYRGIENYVVMELNCARVIFLKMAKCVENMSQKINAEASYDYHCSMAVGKVDFDFMWYSFQDA